MFLRSFWRSDDRFSLSNFKYIINELQGIEDVDTFNREIVVDLLQSIVEIITFGDKHDPSIFECFMEHQVLSDFVRMLEISRNSRIQVKVLQYLSIMIQNLHSEHAIYYCLSNGYINSIIKHDYEFHDVSGKLNRDTICLLLEVEEGVVTSFPLYTEALKFAHHGEKMIQIAVRSLTLSIYNVSDDVVYQFLVTPPVSEYFSDVVCKLKEECVHLDATVRTMRNNCITDKRSELISGSDKLLDNLFYIKDLLCVGKSCLSNLVTEKFLGLLVVPIVLQLLDLEKTDGVDISAVTSLYFLSRFLQVLDKKEMVDFVAYLILYPRFAFTTHAAEADADDGCQIKPSSEYLNKIKLVLCSSFDPGEVDKEKMLGHALKHKLSARHLIGIHLDNLQESCGICSDKLDLLLAPLMLLLILAESEDLDTILAAVFCFNEISSKTDDAAVSKPSKQSYFNELLPQILNVLLNVLANTRPSPVIQWHVGWFILKLIYLRKSTVSHQELLLHNVTVQLHDLFHRARECLLTELSRSWFDYIPDTFEKEWTRCRTALEESCSNKDPFFLLEIAIGHQFSDDLEILQYHTNVVSAFSSILYFILYDRNADYRRNMRIFVLHLQLKAYVLIGSLPCDPLKISQSTSLINPRHDDSLDSSARFGAEVSLASGIPCKIAFSKVGLRDIFVIPVAKGISGKLLLLEKHPIHSRRGIVFATAPLAGLTPKIDELQATWLHLHVRDTTPKVSSERSRTNTSYCQTDARWTLGFPDTMACEAASLLIAEETSKQRSIVESLLAPYLSDHYPQI